MSLRKTIPVTITNNGSATMPVGQAVSFSWDMAADVTAGYTTASGYGVRVQYYNGSNWVEINRAPDAGKPFNTSATTIWFPIQATIAASGTDSNYRVALYSGVSAPSYDARTRNTVGDYASIALACCNAMLAKNVTAFGSGETFWTAAPGYAFYGSFSADQWLAMSAAPELFTAAQINGIVTKMNQPNANALLPVNVTVDGTPRYNVGAGDAFDSDWTLPMLTLIAYQKNATLTTFTSVKANLKAALLAVPLDGDLFYASGSPLPLSFGFYDGYARNGHNTAGTVFFIRACQAMATLYTAAGDSANATTFTNLANTSIAALQSPSSPLWDAGGSGMMYVSDGNGTRDKIIDVYGTCHAAAMGYLTSSQAQGVADWMHNNLSSILNAQGYIRESTTPSTPDVYDDGYWTYGMYWVLDALKAYYPADCQTIVQQYVGTGYEDVEWIGASISSTGYRNNLCSPFGFYGWLRDNPTVVVNGSSTFTGPDYSGVFPYWDDCLTEKAYTPQSGWDLWTKNASNWQGVQGIDTGNNYQPTQFTVASVGTTNWTAQCDVMITSLTLGGDHPAGSIGGSATSSIAVGVQVSFRANSQTTVNVLNKAVAWGGTPFSFNWTTNTLYTVKVRRVGNSISCKAWVAGTAEPANYGTALTVAIAGTTTFALDPGFGTVRYSNIIVNSAVSAEPTVAAGTASTYPPATPFFPPFLLAMVAEGKV